MKIADHRCDECERAASHEWRRYGESEWRYSCEQHFRKAFAPEQPITMLTPEQPPIFTQKEIK